ncbi:Na(+)/H(+) antiporter subunit C [Kurthia zopfii]|uniref:Multiple resistance and pH homeostasis protein C n=1 Tax=Kurthia zopfii TaxID=1650 RepID=A0A2U3AC28_9BACL|nr:Na(+)/H(+) antiporter subunit C [Kurthia zopfii]PWI22080.1 Na(+)/H(+) antiporter subunit C [Kurthia zopfii]TDR37775.1 multisubunit sodium/proton antiporter MrpC subunit [Kurthia zopfii]STX08451.1 Multiple resistance and pH homeostasis protein C [Kurthia zopfii]VEI05301.1 Multiple resistance and pH homeostasis protein C [Kurthia zopfii]GEK30874.1 Na(+)/H(+) antiporter subunit C [Kurthia zopfii]
METLMVLLIGIFVSVATYLLLSKNIIRIIIGTALLSHAVHLLILTIGEVKKGDVPLLKEKPGPYTDALPQALILTAIVISFAVTAFVLVLAYRAYAKNGTDDVEEMRGDELE